MLDIGSGTGVPTIWLAEKFSGSIIEIDPDKNALDWLQKKAINRNLSKRITTLNKSFFYYKAEPDYFDLILAEGFLNVVGFEIGFPRIIDSIYLTSGSPCIDAGDPASPVDTDLIISDIGCFILTRERLAFNHQAFQ